MWKSQRPAVGSSDWLWLSRRAVMKKLCSLRKASIETWNLLRIYIECSLLHLGRLMNDELGIPLVSERAQQSLRNLRIALVVDRGKNAVVKQQEPHSGNI